MHNFDYFSGEDHLDDFLSLPSDALIGMMKRLPGDIMILGIAGKMGLTMGKRAVNAINAAGCAKTVYGVSRFSRQTDRDKLESWGIKTIVCDLLDRHEVNKLPQVPNIIFTAGRKFSTGGNESATWAMNTLVPGNVAEQFKNSSIVAFSTGCVYPLMGSGSGGATEDTPPAPVGEYAQSCLGRERIFQYAASAHGTKALLFRLNYAIDMRYGVLHDIAQQVWNGEEVNNSVGHFNAVWQGDANDIALRCLEHCSNPPEVLNATGPETVLVKFAAEEFGRIFSKKVSYAAETSGDLCYLNNAAKLFSRFGYPSVPLLRMIRLQAEWIRRGGASLGKPTRFEVSNGKF